MTPGLVSHQIGLYMIPQANPPFGGLENKCIESGKGMPPLQTYLAKKEPESGIKKNRFA